MLNEGIDKGLLSRDALSEAGYISRISYSRLEEMQKAGLLDFAGFTPTDALHVLKKFDRWDTQGSIMGADMLSGSKFSTETVAQSVYGKFIALVALNIFKKSMMLNRLGSYITGDVKKLFIKILSDDMQKVPSLKFKIDSEIIGIGAPAWAFIKEVAGLLGEEGRIPVNAEVAGAVGAAVSSFAMKYSVWISPMKDGIFRAHLPMGVCDFEDLETAVDSSERFMAPWICERAKKTGAKEPIVETERIDEVAISTGGAKVHLWTELFYSVKDQKGRYFQR